ncbi:Protein NYNRIN [Trichinella sp. T6]|nr:Protein NYNRIN [Trichinella sp. T6]
MPAHEEEGGVLGPHHFGKRDRYGPKQNLCRVGVAGTDLRVEIAAVPGVGVILLQIRQRLCECRRPVTPAVGKRGRVGLVKRLQFIVDVDASGDGLGAVLSQREGKAERVVAYSSRTLTKAERRYCATRREMLGFDQTFKEPEGQVAGWLESLAELDFGKGVRASSRLPNSQLKTWRRALKPSCSPHSRQTQRSNYCGNGWLARAGRDMHMLWQQRRSWVDEDSRIWRPLAEKGAKQALVPRVLRNEVLQSMHDSRCAGHLSEQRTLARVRSRFYWPGMSGDVHAWCRTCTQCARRKGLTKNNRAPMQVMAAGYLLQRVGMDILGPLEKTLSGDRCVLNPSLNPSQKPLLNNQPDHRGLAENQSGWMTINTTQPTRPFENTGLDVASPLLTRSGKTVKKSYPHIYQHDHPSSTPGISRHGKPRILQSDNFRSFKQLDQELQLLSNKKMADCLEKELSAHRIQWKIPCIKYCKRLVDEEGLSTIRCDIEARTNARPLTYLSEDLKDPEVLTPYHFLPGTKFMDLPEVNPEDEEWVPKLKLLHSSENNEASKVRDIVSIEECNVPRNKWKLGRIIAVYPGKDGIARTAK